MNFVIIGELGGPYWLSGPPCILWVLLKLIGVE